MNSESIELPLFPLSVVLFPGQTLPLHVFEPRYRAMIQRCVDDESPFGVVLVNEEDGSPYSVGTYARITQVEETADGRMNILTVGVERFILESVRLSDDDYLIGDAMPYPFRNDIKPTKDLKRSVARQLRDYLRLLADVNEMEFRFDQFPKESAGIAVFAAIALQLPLDDKQELLATESVSELLRKESRILSDELFTLRLMSRSVKPPEEIGDGVFSMN